MSHLSSLQKEGADWLAERPKRYLADPPGFGKTRTVLSAVGNKRLLVVAPAKARDTRVWQSEAETIGWDGSMHAVSYHQMSGAKGETIDASEYDAIVFDEAHHLKEVRPQPRTKKKAKRVGWSDTALRLSKEIESVYLASGTPTPNHPMELWPQLAMIRDMPARWTWLGQWFDVTPGMYAYGVSDLLIGCTTLCNAREELTPGSCPHWAAFREANQVDWMLARPEDSLDLPPMVGYETPLWTPMTPEQGRVYRDLKKAYLADLPDGGTLEALTSSQRYVQMAQVATGLSSADPESDDRHSGKLATLAEVLSDGNEPALVVCYYKNSAKAIGRVLERLGLSWRAYGAATTPKAAREAIGAFQEGSLDVLLGSIGVVSESITLTAGKTVHLVERSWVPDINYQTVRRVRRRGQSKTTVVRQYITPNTTDERQWLRIANKAALTAKVDPARLV